MYASARNITEPIQIRSIPTVIDRSSLELIPATAEEQANLAIMINDAPTDDENDRALRDIINTALDVLAFNEEYNRVLARNIPSRTRATMTMCVDISSNKHCINERLRWLPSTNHNRGKRSLLPVIGEAYHWLFGIARDSDIQTVEADLKLLPNIPTESVSKVSRSQNDIISNMNKLNVDFLKSVESVNASIHGLKGAWSRLEEDTAALKGLIASQATAMDIQMMLTRAIAAIQYVTNALKLIKSKIQYLLKHYRLLLS